VALGDGPRLGTDPDEGQCDSARAVLTRRYNELVEPFITRSGRELSEEDIEALADEAERGYDLDKAIRVTVGRPTSLSAEALLDRWRNLPAVNPDALRADIDRTLDGGL
jgi:hypothetical protein